MRYAVIGTGAMGGAVGTLMARAGEDVTFVDTDHEIVRRVSQDGFSLEGAAGQHRVSVRISAEPQGAGWADAAIVLTPTYETAAAGRTALRILKPEGFAVTLQNGIGNVETLAGILGASRVAAGSILSSAQRLAPGESDLTKLDPTRIGEIDGTISPRVQALAGMLDAAGFQASAVENVAGVMWSKLIHNAAINPICAASGLVQSETSKVPELEALRAAVVQEALEVARAEGINLPNSDPLPALRQHVASKSTRPSMLQHIEAGRPTEIDAINGALVRIAARHGINAPANAALVGVIKGLERAALLRRG
ncbi:MAG TPA: ketopantoate reductase family protein [Hyphomicrobiaceae bacterium]|nr:ketopantoate reductase family protein [Hyphomicrobiaceae bacterium]